MKFINYAVLLPCSLPFCFSAISSELQNDHFMDKEYRSPLARAQSYDEYDKKKIYDLKFFQSNLPTDEDFETAEFLEKKMLKRLGKPNKQNKNF
jgi:hypothetical protein